MPAEWDIYLERMGAEEANASYEHKARAYPGRARQFMPFSALRGYEEMLTEVEQNAIAEEGRFTEAYRDDAPQ